jgi:hypothetical protein
MLHCPDVYMARTTYIAESSRIILLALTCELAHLKETQITHLFQKISCGNKTKAKLQLAKCLSTLCHFRHPVTVNQSFVGIILQRKKSKVITRIPATYVQLRISEKEMFHEF